MTSALPLWFRPSWLLFSFRAWRFRAFPPRRMRIEGRDLVLVARVKGTPTYLDESADSYDGMGILKSNPWATEHDFYIASRRGHEQLKAAGLA